MHTHKVVTAEQVSAAASEIGRAARVAAENADAAALRDVNVEIPLESSALFQPLGDAWIPGPFRSLLVANLGAAGLLLMISAIFRARTVGFFAYLGALVTLLGPAFGLTSAWLSSWFDAPVQAMVSGAILLLVGVVFGRR